MSATGALETAVERASTLPALRSLLVAHEGQVVVEKRFRGPPLDHPVNVKSVAKSVISALVGIAIEEGHLDGSDQAIWPFFRQYLGPEADPDKRKITIGHLLSMQSGLERTSGAHYGRWVASPNWVRHAIRRPMVREPGGAMMYSTGNTHLLSAILTRATGRSTHTFAKEKLAEPLGIHLPKWRRDPQGIYFGGNQMGLSPRAMLRFGELYRNGGHYGGHQIIPERGVRQSLRPRGESPFSGERYGYGWFISTGGDHPMFYAWGHGGQFIFVVRELSLTVVTTSEIQSGHDFEHLRAIHELVSKDIVSAVE
jgi:CubicO group peptidase (beta-lactamase class C family)